MRRANDRCLNGFIYVTLPSGVRGSSPGIRYNAPMGAKVQKSGAPGGEIGKRFLKNLQIRIYCVPL